MVNEEETQRKIVWTNTAKQDLYKIYQRVEAASPEEAKNIVQAVLYAVEQLLENPHQGKIESLLGGEKKSYKFITAGFYKILHNTEGSATFIRSIFHLRQMPSQNPAFLKDLESKAEKIANEQRVKMEAIRAEQAKKAEEERAKQAALEAEIAAQQASQAEVSAPEPSPEVEAQTEATPAPEEVEAQTETPTETNQETPTETNQETSTEANPEATSNPEQDIEDIDALLAKLDEQAKQMGE